MFKTKTIARMLAATSLLAMTGAGPCAKHGSRRH